MSKIDLKLSELMIMGMENDMTGLQYLKALKRLKEGDPESVKYYWQLMADCGVFRNRCLNCTKLIKDVQRDKKGNLKRGRRRRFCIRKKGKHCFHQFWYNLKKEEKQKRVAEEIREEIERLKGDSQ
jgi:hypothetical protein